MTCVLEGLRDVEVSKIVEDVEVELLEVVVDDEVRKTRPAARPMTAITMITITIRPVLEADPVSPGHRSVDLATILDQLDEVLRIQCLSGVTQSFFRTVMHLNH